MTDCDVLPRQGFTQMARNMRCQLYFPYPAEQLMLLRTGVLVHINAYMQALGLHDSDSTSATAQPTDSKLPAQAPQHNHIHSNGIAHGPEGESTGAPSPQESSLQGQVSDVNAEDEDQDSPGADANGDSHSPADAATAADADGAAAIAAAAAVDWHGTIPDEQRAELQRVWQRLKQTVEALPHVGCYTVASVAYRRQAFVCTPLCMALLLNRCVHVSICRFHLRLWLLRRSSHDSVRIRWQTVCCLWSISTLSQTGFYYWF